MVTAGAGSRFSERRQPRRTRRHFARVLARSKPRDARSVMPAGQRYELLDPAIPYRFR